MDYLISLLEGIITFISPCMLPMLPLYISYFAGGQDNGDRKKTLINAFGFVLGFTIVFTALGAFAGTFGGLLTQYALWVNLIGGAIVLVFGLNYLGILNLSFLQRVKKVDYQPKSLGFFSAVLFGVVFSIGWTPCVGAFLGSALMLAATAQDSLKGILMLLSFSFGLGIPFVISALLLDRLKHVFDFIKRNYKIVNGISGFLLVIVGLAMMTGLLGKLLTLLTF